MSALKSSSKLYPEYPLLDLPELEKEILSYWKENGIFQESLRKRRNAPNFVFYEGPPSANGMPGIHHVISRTIKDIFCRYKTLQGYKVERKAGWDTHGLPIELQVEKSLGITKEDIGVAISIEDYNAACRRDVLKFKDIWDDLTNRIGYWVDLENPYVTYDNAYIESVWNILRQLHDKGYLYKGHSIQPYSPAAGTGLSSHELNQPGTYRNIKDTSVVAQFRLIEPEKTGLNLQHGPVYCLAWTTTPWTLPSNTALGVGSKIDYAAVQTFNPYTGEPLTALLAESLIPKWFKSEGAERELNSYSSSDKVIPWKIVQRFKGNVLSGLKYEQLLPYVQPKGRAFEIVLADFVSTDDGTGIVHLAPSFGADDFRTARQFGLASLTLVDKQGRFVPEMGEFAGMYVKNYDNQDERDPKYKSVDVLLAIKLKEENKAFHVEKYEHSYPHCWRTDKPILYYPLESWFIKTTAVRERLISANREINWKPKSTGEGRFGNWLENLVDWNLSRSRYWGTPLPIWRSEDAKEELCIGSLEELSRQVERSIQAGHMTENPVAHAGFDLHRPFIDRIVLTGQNGQPLYREPDLIDVWFDSGAMPYAQLHYPFENRDRIDGRIQFPADFIAEGVDQTRGWFFTLHVLAVMLFDSPAYRNVLANGLVLDKDGNKMSKRLGNTIDPFKTIDEFGADVVRWYMIWNSAPWENLKFNVAGLQETQRKFFGTLFNLYSFFALYANLDGYEYSKPTPVAERPEIDRWIISRLHHLISAVQLAMDDYEPTRATREIQSFTTDHLSNWYVRLCRRRFWKSGDHADKKMAYDTLYECLNTVSVLMSSFAPFYADRLYRDLRGNPRGSSVHLADFPKSDSNLLDPKLELKMDLAQQITSMVLAIRKKEKIKVRQPLSRILIPSLGNSKDDLIRDVAPLVLAEVNVKKMDFIGENSEIRIVRSIKPDFKTLGPRAGSQMKTIAAAIQAFTQTQIEELQSGREQRIQLPDGGHFVIESGDVEIGNQDMPGWQIETEGTLTVALDIQIDEALRLEGHARELVNRIQNLRKDSGLQVADRILVRVSSGLELLRSIELYNDYICAEVLAEEIQVADNEDIEPGDELNGIPVVIEIMKR